ncbi:MAG TPA: hypothetical protein VLJ59_04085 [Mycobacteriales bacterium]|nr:hypothetical protein [Mycobacteriales bacterium]
MRMVMEHGCPDEYRTTALQSRVQDLEARVQRLEEELALLRSHRAGPPALDRQPAWDVPQP